jgi:DNA-binding transcriptional LysR family regulator
VVELGMSDRQVDLVEERWDMAVRIGRLVNSSLVARKLADMHLVVCGSPAYLARRGTPRHVSDLAQHDCLGFTLSGFSQQIWRFGIDGIDPPAGARHAAGGQWRRAGRSGGSRARPGLWPALHRRARALAEGRLVEVTLDQPMAPMGAIYAITHPARRPAAKTRAWIEFLAETVPAMAAAW